MTALLSPTTAYLSAAPCDGSSRKLIAGWWYCIIFLSIVQIIVAMSALSSRGGAQSFVAMWSSLVLLLLCIGGTIIMRKFQTSLAVGFFMGSVVAGSQMFLLLFLLFFAYIEDRLENDLSVDGERLAGFLCLVQSLMLGAFAAILAAHRSEILDQKITLDDDNDGEDDVEDGNEGGTSSYNPPKQKVTVV